MSGGIKRFLPVGHQFLTRREFDPFVGVSRHASAHIYASLFRCYTAYYSGQVEEWRARMSSSWGRITSATSTSKAVTSVDVSGAGRSGSVTSSQSKRASKKSQRQGKSC